MKCVHVLPNCFPESLGGTEVYCWNLCKHLQRMGVVAEVITPGYGQYSTTEYEYDGIKVFKYAEPTIQTRLHINGLDLPEGINHFKSCLIKIRPDLVHIHGIYRGVGITLQHIAEIKSLGIPIVYTMHLPGHICTTQTLIRNESQPCDGIIRPKGCATCSMMYQGHNKLFSEMLTGISSYFHKMGIDPGYWNNRLGTALSGVSRIIDLKRNLGRLSELCDKVVVLSKWFQKMMGLNGFPVEKMEYVHPAISYSDAPEIAQKRLRFNNVNTVKLIFVGRIDPVKDVKLLLKAFKNLPEDKIELSIYGKPSNLSYYNECIELSENKRNIHWRGLFSRDELMSIFRQHDMLCLPSAFSEMSPLVIQEAFGARIPVLASDVLGNAELINNNVDGILFPYKSMEILQYQLNRLIGDSDLLTTLKNGVILPTPFETVAGKYLSIYLSVRRGNQDISLRKPVELDDQMANSPIKHRQYYDARIRKY